ncbi:hypothetical protein ABT364_03305 [Massilia sp. SR12]
MFDDAPLLIGMVLPSLPFLALSIAGLTLSIVRRTRHPRAALCAALGFGCLFLDVTLSLVQQYMYMFASGSATERADHLWIYTVTYVLRLATFVAIAIAIFVERPNAQQNAARDVQQASA